MNGQNREEESEALEILKTYVSMEEYTGYIIADKPDLQNPDMRAGVEVVRAFHQNEPKVSNAVHQSILCQRGEPHKIYKPKALENILEQNKSELLNLGGIIVGYKSPNLIEEAEAVLIDFIDGKAQKRQTQYTTVDFCDLFVFDETTCAGSDYFKRRTISIANTLFCKDNYHMFFAKIFIYHRNYCLLSIIDIKQKKVSFIEC